MTLSKDKNLLIFHALIAGLMCSLLSITLSVSSDLKFGFIKFSKYIPLALVLISHAINLKPVVEDRDYFPKLLSGGLFISWITGTFLMLSVLILFAIDPHYAPMKFNLLPASWLDAITISVMQLFETTALGFTINLIVFQYFKLGPKTLNA